MIEDEETLNSLQCNADSKGIPTERSSTASTGGISPFGYRWRGGSLVIDEKEAPIRKLIFELFIKNKRKKTVAKLLNDLGYRTRNDALFSDTTIDRLLRDTTAKGIRIVNEIEIKVEAIITEDLWQKANNLLGEKKQTKQAANLFTGIAFCSCGGKMIVPSNSEKYVCLDCRYKIGADDLEEIFVSQLENHSPTPAGKPSEVGGLSRGRVGGGGEPHAWGLLNQKEKRIVIEQICDRITVSKEEILIESSYLINPYKTAANEQHNREGNETPESNQNESQSDENQSPRETLSEPTLSEAEAAKFLNVSKMTLMRRRKAKEIGFYQQGFRITYSKERHLIPYLEKNEK